MTESGDICGVPSFIFSLSSILRANGTGVDGKNAVNSAIDGLIPAKYMVTAIGAVSLS